jgi:aldehyde dehydrogenase (NAD+)
MNIAQSVLALRQAYEKGGTPTLKQRLATLDKLAAALKVFERPLYEALKSDLGKSEHEAYVSEIAVLENEIHTVRKHLKKWMKPKCVRSPIYLWPASSRIYYEPLGVVLVIGPWNYPAQLVLGPLIGALAAGNAVVVKPSELAPATSRVLTEMLRSVLRADQVLVVEGGIEPTTELLKQKFDHIFFTGSTKVGKIIYQAAAAQLTPVTLELGGKSPAFVMPSADLDLAARRLVWGKFLNAGQTCVAPDYIYAHSSIKDQLLAKLSEEIRRQLGAAQASGDYGRIINATNFDRLLKMLDRKKIYFGGETDRSQRFIAPTILNNAEWTDAVMGEEIFGPILPVLSFENFASAGAEALKHGKPLAAYIFTSDSGDKREFLQNFHFGGGCINDCIVHLVNDHLPFGGVGASGIGGYHGHHSFLTFSHHKSVVQKSKWLDLAVRYPPFSAGKLASVKALMKMARF